MHFFKREKEKSIDTAFKDAEYLLTKVESIHFQINAIMDPIPTYVLSSHVL